MERCIRQGDLLSLFCSSFVDNILIFFTANQGNLMEVAYCLT